MVVTTVVLQPLIPPVVVTTVVLLPPLLLVVATVVAQQLPAAAKSVSAYLHGFSNAARNRAVATMVVLLLLHAVVTMVAPVSSKLLRLQKMLPLKPLAKMLLILRHRLLILRLPVRLSVASFTPVSLDKS